MMEFLYDPDTPAAAEPASPEQIDMVGQYARHIEDYPKFKTSLVHRDDLEAHDRVGNTTVAISSWSQNLTVRLWEFIPETNGRVEKMTDGSRFLRRSAYDFIHQRDDSYKFDPKEAYEQYYVQFEKQTKQAFPERYYNDRSVGWSPFRRHEMYKRKREVEAMWNVGVLTVARCAELIEIVKAFDYDRARPARMNAS